MDVPRAPSDGSQAYIEGYDFGENPFGKGTADWHGWIAAWNAAREAQPPIGGSP